MGQWSRPQQKCGWGLWQEWGMLGGGYPCWDSQLSEGADPHGCTLWGHLQCSSLSLVALLLQEAA